MFFCQTNILISEHICKNLFKTVDHLLGNWNFSILILGGFSESHNRTKSTQRMSQGGTLLVLYPPGLILELICDLETQRTVWAGFHQGAHHLLLQLLGCPH